MCTEVRRPMAVVASAVLLLFLVACGGTPSSQESSKPVRGGTLRVALAAQPSSLNPVLGTSGSADYIAQYPMFDTFTEFNSETGEADPRLAESWAFTDPRTFVMKLRPGVKFHDGTALDGEAATWFLNHARGPEGGGAQVDLARISSVEASGPLEVTVHLKEPFSGLPWVLSGRPGMVMSPTAYQKDPEGFAQHPVGAGPYEFVSYKTGTKLTVKRFDDYWNPDSVFPDAIEFTVFAEPTTIVNAIENGEQDLSFSVSPKDVERLKANSNVSVVTGDSLLLDQIHLNRSIKPLDDPRVRKALYLALDRDAFVKAATFGLGQPGYQFAAEGTPAASTSIADEYAHDTEEAQRLLAEAGYPDGFSVEMLTQSGELEVRKAEVLKSQLAEIGVEVEIRPTELTQAVTEMFKQGSSGMFFAYGVNRADIADAIHATFDEGALYNLPHEAHPAVVKALDKANAVADTDERNGYLQQTAETLADEGLFLPVAFHPFVAVSTRSVHGVQIDRLLKPRLDGAWITK